MIWMLAASFFGLPGWAGFTGCTAYFAAPGKGVKSLPSENRFASGILYSFFMLHRNFPNISQKSPRRTPIRIAAAAFKSPPAANMEKDPIKAPGTNPKIRFPLPAHIKKVVKKVITSPAAGP